MPVPQPLSRRPKQKARYGHRWSRWLAIPALLLLALSVCFVAPVGLANAWYFKANHYLGLWTEQQALFGLDSWQQASLAIDKAIRLHPKHPHYLLTKAKINEWGWYGGLMTSKELEQTEQYYIQAIEVRPTWPNAYADYAYYLGVTQFRITEAFEQLRLAKRYGPYMPETLLRQLAIGLLRWSNLNPTQKTDTLQALKNAVQAGYPTYVKALAVVKETQQTALACSYLNSSKKAFTPQLHKRIQKDFCARKTAI